MDVLSEKMTDNEDGHDSGIAGVWLILAIKCFE